MNNKFVTILAFSLTCGSIAHASNWVVFGKYIASTKQPKCHSIYSIDTETWHYNGNVVSAWTKLELSPNHKACFLEPFKMSHVLEEYDCSSRMSRLIYGRFEEWNGKSSSGEVTGKYSEWAPVIPDSIGETEMNFVCSHLPSK